MPKAAPRQSGAKAARTKPYETTHTVVLPASPSGRSVLIEKNPNGPDKRMVLPLADEVTYTQAGKDSNTETKIAPKDRPAILPPPSKTSTKVQKPVEKTTAKVKKSTEEKTTVKAPKAIKAGKARPEGTFLDIKLDGEDKNEVPLYDTCSEVRRKINLLLTKDKSKPENGMPNEFTKDGKPKPWTKSAFCKQLNISTTVLNTFMAPKKIKLMGGADSEAYRAGYIFFEKKRIFEGKKKSAGRLKVEAEYA